MTVCCGEEFRRDALLRRLPGDGLGAVLAELEGGGVFLVRPGAARAVEAVGLVRAQQQRRRLGDVHLLGDRLGRRPQGAPSARRRVVAVDARNVAFFHVWINFLLRAALYFTRNNEILLSSCQMLRMLDSIFGTHFSDLKRPTAWPLRPTPAKAGTLGEKNRHFLANPMGAWYCIFQK